MHKRDVAAKDTKIRELTEILEKYANLDNWDDGRVCKVGPDHARVALGLPTSVSLKKTRTVKPKTKS